MHKETDFTSTKLQVTCLRVMKNKAAGVETESVYTDRFWIGHRFMKHDICYNSLVSDHMLTVPFLFLIRTRLLYLYNRIHLCVIIGPP